MQIGPYHFKPGIIPTLALILVMPLLISLGFWQLDRYQIKVGLVEEHAQNRARPVVEVSSREQIDGLGRARAVSLSGEFDQQRHILLINRKHAGRPGFDVYTPFRLESGDSVLVTRGWLPDLTGRDYIPEVPVTAGKIRLEALINTPPSIGIKVGDSPQVGDLGWPRKVFYVDMAWLGKELQLELPQYTILQVSPEEPAYIRNWEEHFKKPGGIPAERHMSYAVQWFALCLAVVVIYLVVNLKRIK